MDTADRREDPLSRSDISRVVRKTFGNALVILPLSGESRRVANVRSDELQALSHVYGETCNSTEGAIEGFRMGWEVGSLSLTEIPFSNRTWRKDQIEPMWCAQHGVAEDAIELVLAICGSMPDAGEAVRLAFEIAHEAATVSAGHP